MRLLIFLSFFILPVHAQHTLAEGISMINAGTVHLDKMIVKYSLQNSEQKEIYCVWGRPKNNQLQTKKFFSTNTLSSKTLSSYEQIKFRKSLSKSQAVIFLENLYSQSNIELAFFEPMITTAESSQISNIQQINKIKSSPDFQNLQDYLQPAPLGIDAHYAWTIPGGTGRNIKIMDIETGIDFEHEDYSPLFYLGELPKGKSHHGTAVRGILNASNDGRGVTGIVFDAQFGFLSRLENNNQDSYIQNVAMTILKAIDKLETGDVLVLEMHSLGPKFNYIPIEYWQPVFDVLKIATQKGIHCVAAAGNGGQSLDNKVYSNAFDKNHRDSGCVLVGAALKDLSRHEFSNYGSRIDAFGYGEKVVTTGYGDLHNGGETKEYTKNFGGTSSATPIVAGAIAAISSIAKEQGRSLSPNDVRSALRSTGTYPVGNFFEHIGNMPDLRQLIEHLNL